MQGPEKNSFKEFDNEKKTPAAGKDSKQSDEFQARTW